MVLLRDYLNDHKVTTKHAGHAGTSPHKSQNLAKDNHQASITDRQKQK